MPLVRLDKLLAESAGIPRAEARKQIMKGAVTADGVTCRKIDEKVPETASLTLSGRPLQWQKFVYIMLDKPKGVVSAAEDKSDTTVVDLVKDRYPRRQLFPAGRLDKTSTGFVLLTDDGTFAHDLLAPRRHVDKTYLVEIDTPLTEVMIQGFESGVTLADGSRMDPAGLAPVENAPCQAVVTLHQGVYHQIKRMFGVFDAGVNELRRISIGGVALDENLGPGGSRNLTEAELSVLRAAIAEKRA